MTREQLQAAILTSIRAHPDGASALQIIDGVARQCPLFRDRAELAGRIVVEMVFLVRDGVVTKRLRRYFAAAN
jgi:hypothetical protein